MKNRLSILGVQLDQEKLDKVYEEFLKLADKTLDIGLSSRALKDDEKADVEGTTIALDGIAIIVNNASKVEDLTVDQLKQMFTGEVTNWSEVGGDDGEIVLIGREAGSGTRDGFESIVDVRQTKWQE